METAKAGGVFNIVCHDKDGVLRWSEETPNLVVNTGLQNMNARYFAGTSYTSSFYLGLISGPGASNTYSAADTLASHSGWTEFTSYSGSRKAGVFGSATAADPSVINNSASPASFLISASGTISGVFLCTVASGTSGILFSASNLQSPGDRSVYSGDTLTITYTFNLAAA